jgi:hypothetical protein
MRIDFTLTLPGLFEVTNIQALADQFGVDVLAKVVFSFSPDIVMSPLALPRHILDRKIDALSKQVTGALRNVLLQLKTRATFEEQWPDQFRDGLLRGKRRILKLESIRQDKHTMDEILKQDRDIYVWWNKIA